VVVGTAVLLGIQEEALSSLVVVEVALTDPMMLMAMLVVVREVLGVLMLLEEAEPELLLLGEQVQTEQAVPLALVMEAEAEAVSMAVPVVLVGMEELQEVGGVLVVVVTQASLAATAAEEK
jgi:hypothetical protein